MGKVTRSKAVRTVAANALTQSKAPCERTSKKVASAASKVLADSRVSKAAKSAAGRVLAQAQGVLMQNFNQLQDMAKSVASLFSIAA